MLGILFDAVALAAILWFVDREESGDLWNLVVTAFLMMVVNIGLGLLLYAPLGLWAMLPMYLICSLILKYRCDLSWTKALFAMQILFALKIGFWLAFERAIRA